MPKLNLQFLLIVFGIVLLTLRFRRPIMDFLAPLPLVGPLLNGDGLDGGEEAAENPMN